MIFTKCKDQTNNWVKFLKEIYLLRDIPQNLSVLRKDKKNLLAFLN